MGKIGRNSPCPCGSGNKFKRCCASRGVAVTPQQPGAMKRTEDTLVQTLTNELFQPMRLYYIIHDRADLETRLRRLKCVMQDDNLNDWVINYTQEAANIKLKVPPSKIPKEARPLVIATLYIDSDDAMLVDIRSIERAAAMITFIDQYIPKTVAEITYAAIYNKLIYVEKNERSNFKDVDYDEIFSQKQITVIDPEQAFRDAEEIGKQYTDPEEKLVAFMRSTEEKTKKPLPVVEKFPVHFYEEGVKQFFMMCMMRQAIAMQHFLGKKEYTFYDLTQEMLGNQAQ